MEFSWWKMAFELTADWGQTSLKRETEPVPESQCIIFQYKKFSKKK
jgi:hypothetical protein